MIYPVLLLLLTIVSAATCSDLFSLPSGRLVSIQAVHKHHSTVRFQDLPHILFERLGNDLICSHHACLNISELAPEDHLIVEKDHSHNRLSYLDKLQPRRSSRIRSGNEYTFAISPLSDILITAWGPSLHLHPLSTLQYPGVLVNAAALNSPNFARNDGTVSDRVSMALSRVFSKVEESHAIFGSSAFETSGMSRFPFISSYKRCKREYTLELGIEFDNSYCSLYDNNHYHVWGALSALEHKISRIFYDIACVRISFEEKNGNCNNWHTNRNGEEKTPPTSQAPCLENYPCPFSNTILQFMSENYIDSFSFEPDGTFLLTRYGDNYTLGGASYRSSACNVELSCAWVGRDHELVIVHEIGHMLGADHDSTGIMKETIDVNEPPLFSNNSQAKIRRFVERDSRSWCLRQPSHDLSSFYKVPGNRPTQVASSFITYASLDSESHDDLIAVRFYNNQNKILFLHQMRNDSDCNQAIEVPALTYSGSTFQNRDQLLQVEIPSGPRGFNIGFGHIANETSKDLIVSFWHKGDDGVVPVYKIGYGIGHDGSAPASWSSTIIVPTLSAKNIQLSSLAIGHLRDSSSIDLVYAVIERRFNRNILKYTVGFNIGKDGRPRDNAWTTEINVPGWYGRNTSALDVSLLDVDRDGKLELLIYHVAEWHSRKVPYLRIGRSLDEYGHVTNGWTKYIQDVGPTGDRTYMLDGGMAVTKTKCHGLKITSISENFPLPDGETRLITSVLEITKELLETSEQLTRFEYFQDGCYECYSDWNSRKCITDLYACSARVNEVRLTSVAKRTSTDFVSSEQNRNLWLARSSDFTPDNDSIYCTGFHDLYKNSDGCEITDGEIVLAKGVERSFLDVLGKIDTNAATDATSTILLEHPAGTNGNQKSPTAVRIIVVDKKGSRRAAIDRALGMLRKRRGFSSIRYDTEKRGDKYYVLFYL